MPVRYIPHPIQAIRTVPVRALDPGLGAYVNMYQNPRLRPILVQVSVECTQAVVANMARFVAYTGPTNIFPQPGNVAGYGGYQGLVGAGTKFAHFYLAFLVPAGYWFRVAADQGAGNTVALNIWVELEL